MITKELLILIEEAYFMLHLSKKKEVQLKSAPGTANKEMFCFSLHMSILPVPWFLIKKMASAA